MGCWVLQSGAPTSGKSEEVDGDGDGDKGEAADGAVHLERALECEALLIVGLVAAPDPLGDGGRLGLVDDDGVQAVWDPTCLWRATGPPSSAAILFLVLLRRCLAAPSGLVAVAIA